MITSTANFCYTYDGETSDGKAWTSSRRSLGGGRYAYVVRFIAGQGEITDEHRRAARAAIGAAC